ncbi:hypothetical protein JCM10213_006265 [Rhodosporidiobolus nylandii]
MAYPTPAASPAPAPPSSTADSARVDLPATSASPAWHPSSGTKPVLYLTTHLHPVARVRADELFDVIDDNDPRFSEWWNYADACVLRTGRVTDSEARKARSLRIIARNGVGYDMVPLDACKDMGICATYQPGSNAKAVAELALSLSLSVLRRTTELDRRLRRGEDMPNIQFLAETVEGRTLGLVGMGDIARETAKKFYGAYDSPILVYSPTSSGLKWTEQDPSGHPAIPHRRVSSLEELLQQADIVSLHCPLNAQTEKMMSDAQFAMMKKSAVFINTARGGLVDEPALLRALQSQQIYGAGVDVFVTEPPKPEQYGELFQQENVVVNPHAGAGTHRVQIDSCTIAVETCWSWLHGEGIGKSTRLV